MTKQATSIRLSDQAERDIATIRQRFPHMNDTTAIEHALHEYALTLTAAARPPRTGRRSGHEGVNEMNLADEALALCNKLSGLYWHLEREQREQSWKFDHSVRLAKIELVWKRAADRWRRRVGAEPIYRNAPAGA